MKMRLKNNFICIILAIATIISGMCFQYEQADSLFSLYVCAECTASLDSPDISTANSDARAEAISGSRLFNNLYVSEKRGTEKTDSFTESYLSCKKLFSLNSTVYFTTVASELQNDIRSNTVIINYIHQQDGKKA